MMSVTAISFPEAVILKKVLKMQLIVTFFSIVAIGIVIVGYLFNAIYEDVRSSNNKSEEILCQGAHAEKNNIYVFLVQGAADVGALSDQVARKMSKEGKGKMYCMAAVGANIPEKIAPLKSALGTVTIDDALPYALRRCSKIPVFQASIL